MGAKTITALGLFAVLGLTGGKIVRYSQNLNNGGGRTSQFNSYAQDESNDYNWNNLKPYPYIMPTGYSKMKQRIAEKLPTMDLTQNMPPTTYTPSFSSMEIPTVRQLTYDNEQRSVRPSMYEILSMPYSMSTTPYNKSPNYDFTFRPKPFERNYPYYYEQRSEKHIENLGFANRDNMRNFVQRPIFSILDLANLLTLSAVPCGTRDDGKNVKPFEPKTTSKPTDNDNDIAVDDDKVDDDVTDVVENEINSSTDEKMDDATEKSTVLNENPIVGKQPFETRTTKPTENDDDNITDDDDDDEDEEDDADVTEDKEYEIKSTMDNKMEDVTEKSIETNENPNVNEQSIEAKTTEQTNNDNDETAEDDDDVTDDDENEITPSMDKKTDVDDEDNEDEEDDEDHEDDVVTSEDVIERQMAIYKQMMQQWNQQSFNNNADYNKYDDDYIIV